MLANKLVYLFILFAALTSALPAQEQEAQQTGQGTRQTEMHFGVRPHDFDRTQEPVNPPARLIEPLDVRYPDTALRKKLEGTAIVAVAVDKRGDVIYAELHSSSRYPSLDSAALAAVNDGLFKPAQRNGTTVSSRITIPVEFRLAREKEEYDSPKSIEELEQDKKDLEKTKQQLRLEQQQLEKEIEQLKKEQTLKQQQKLKEEQTPGEK